MGWESLLLPAAVAGISYLDYSDKKKRQKELDRRYAAYRNAAIAQPQGGGGRSGGGGGGGGKAAMMAAISGGYGKANDLLAPFVNAGKDIMPAQSEAFKKGLEGFGSFSGQVLNPEFLRNALMFNRPEQAALPAMLVGGK